MNILVVDQTAEGQTKIARMIESFDPTDRDTLDIQMSLASPQNCKPKFSQSDILILGAGLGDDAHQIARQAKEDCDSIEIIIFSPEHGYSSESFRLAQSARVRKVMPENASHMDLLQELVAIHEQFRSAGRTRKGKLIVVSQVKGGVGSTSLIAGLADLANELHAHTLLWDLDIESSDLARGLNVKGSQSQIVSAWIQGTRELNRETLKDAAIPVGNYVSLLTPPHDIAAGMDLVGHPDSIKLIHRIVELAKVSKDNVIVDTAGRLSPATGTLLRMADQILIMIDDSLLGLAAARSYLETILPLVKNNHSAIRIIPAGAQLSSEKISLILGEHIELSPQMWEMPSIPLDPAAAKWPGSGGTLYSLGQKNTRRALEQIAQLAGIGDVGSLKIKQFSTTSKQTESVGWMRMMFQKVANA